MHRTLILGFAALVAAAHLAGAGRTHTDPARAESARVAAPTFIAIGGGLEDDNDAIFNQLLARNDTNKIVIVPFASGDAKAAATRTAERFAKRRPGVTCVTLPDALDGPDAAKLAAEWIPHADLVYFTGGDQSRITPRFLDEKGNPNAILRALQDGQLKWATPVGGTSAGCAVLSDPMFTGGGSESALADLPATDGEPDGDTANATPPKSGVRLGKGLGLIPDVIMDSHFLERGRFGRMVAALEVSNRRFGVGVNENRAVKYASGIFRGIGPQAALVVDAKDLARVGLSRRNLRISLLGDHDTLTMPNAAQDALVELRGEPLPRLPITPPDQPKGGAWSKGVMIALLTRLACDPTSTQRATSDRFEIVVTADESTRFAWRNNDPATLSVAHARLDIIERAPAPEKTP